MADKKDRALQKINPNLASVAELIKVKGIGDVKAAKIANFLEEGGQFNSWEEFQSVAKIPSHFAGVVQESLEFALGKNSVPLIPIDTSDIQENFLTFRIKFSGRDSGYAGYRLMLEYITRWLRPLGKSINKSHQVKYDLTTENELPVKLVYPEKSNISRFVQYALFSPAGNLICKGDLQVEQGSNIPIVLPPATSQGLLVKLLRQQNVDYSDYEVKLTVASEKGSSQSDKKILTQSIKNQDQIYFAITAVGQVTELEVSVLSDYGLPIFSGIYEWSKFIENNGIKELEVELPKPQAISFKINLGPDHDSKLNPYFGHHALLSYQIHGINSEADSRFVEKSFPLNQNGIAIVDLSHYGRITDMVLKVQAPGGEIIGQREMTLADIGEDNEVDILVSPQKLAGFRGAETLPARPKKICGRVIDLKGERKFEDVQVVIYASKEKESKDDDFVPLLLTTTENQGYFIAPMPEGYFQDAIAKIGVPRRNGAEPEIFEVAVRLEDDDVMLVNKEGKSFIEKRSFLPANLILVVDSQERENEPCSKNQCNIDFHKRSKVLDEFSFFSVVRTSEPSIQGYTLEDDGEMAVSEIANIVPVAPDGDTAESSIPSHLLDKRVNKNILLKHINDKRGLTFTTLQRAINESNALKLRAAIKPQRLIKAFGRQQLNLDNAIDWDEDPTIYQATSLAHGHLLHFKQEWRNNGYSLGDLLYSLPLAPGQKKQIVVFDWDRREAASGTESINYNEGLYNSLGRDRDINEIVNGSMAEQSTGGSTSNTISGATGSGGAISYKIFSGVFGISGGGSRASSKAWQNSSRSTALNDLQSLRDQTVQSANAVRSQRSTVIQTAHQGERFSATTETVANYNHCHSMTIQYFEVLRHLEAQQRLASVQECLFVPLIMSPFDNQKILRWREDLYPFVRSENLRRGFSAIERIENDYEGSDLPEGTFAQEDIEGLDGHLDIRFDLPTPVELSTLEEETDVSNFLNTFLLFFPGIQRHIAKVAEAKRRKRDEIFQRYIAPEIASALVEYLRIWAVTDSGHYEPLPLDTTLVSSFQNGRTHYVQLNPSGTMPPLARNEIKAIHIAVGGKGLELANGKTLAENLPDTARVIIKSGHLSYTCRHHSGMLFKKSHINDDLISYGGSEWARVNTPLSRQELRNPHNEDLETASNLKDHLNDNLELYHKVIWMRMSAERRFMFLDGIQVTDYSDPDYSLGIVRSVASVVENRVVGIVGNSLVMPVASGFRLDPNSRGQDVDLHALYKPLTPIDPIHITIPTKGVFAEAVMGSCNSCEKIEDDRYWKWEEHPVPDSPTAFTPVSTDSRTTPTLNTDPTPLSSPVVNIQNAPTAPDPTGLNAAANLLQNAQFKDITGLAGNQANAMAALQEAYKSANSYAESAKDLNALNLSLDAIKKARSNNMIDDETQASSSKATIDAYNKRVAGTNVDSALQEMKAIQDAINSNSIPREQGNKLLDAVADRLKAGQGPLGQEEMNRLINSVASSGASLSYETDGTGQKISVGEVKDPEKAQQNAEETEAVSSLIDEIGDVIKRFNPQSEEVTNNDENEAENSDDVDISDENETDEPT